VVIVLQALLPASQTTRGIDQKERDLDIVFGPVESSRIQLVSSGLLVSDLMLATLRIMRGNLPREQMPWCSLAKGREKTGLVFV